MTTSNVSCADGKALYPSYAVTGAATGRLVPIVNEWKRKSDRAGTVVRGLALALARRWRERAEQRRCERQWRSLANLSDATLQDIGAPPELRAYAEELREYNGLLRMGLSRAGLDDRYR